MNRWLLLILVLLGCGDPDDGEGCRKEVRSAYTPDAAADR